MPILQESQIALLDAARDWRTAYMEFRRLVRDAFYSSDFTQLQLLLNHDIYYFLERPAPTEATIKGMEEHIKRTKRNNDYRRFRKHPPEDPELLLTARSAGFRTVREFLNYRFGSSPSDMETPQIDTPLHPGEKEEPK